MFRVMPAVFEESSIESPEYPIHSKQKPAFTIFDEIQSISRRTSMVSSTYPSLENVALRNLSLARTIDVTLQVPGPIGNRCSGFIVIDPSIDDGFPPRSPSFVPL